MAMDAQATADRIWNALVGAGIASTDDSQGMATSAKDALRTIVQEVIAEMIQAGEIVVEIPAGTVVVEVTGGAGAPAVGVKNATPIQATGSGAGKGIVA